tara:strand:+ start:351 stop:1460 length:1110 start_codon:yes stop_codon:yes gene_type:complete
MAVDYLKTYLGIDPNDYSAMESRIRGDEPPAQSPLMMRQPMMMPQQRSLGDISAMPMMPRQQPVQQNDSKYDGLMSEIASLKAQIEGMQAPTEQVATEQAPVMADAPTEVNMDDARKMFYESPEFKEYQRQTEGMAHTMEYNPSNYTDPTTGSTVSFQDRSGLFQDWYKKTYGRDLAVEDNSFRGSLDSSLGGVLDESKAIQAPVGIENRAVGEPEPFEDKNVFELRQETESMVNPYNELPTTVRMPQAPSQDIQASIDYLAKLPKMNIPQIPDMEEIRRKMAEANMSFPEPVSYQDQLQSIRDIPQPNLPNNFMGNSARNVMSQIQQPQMQSVGRPSTRLAGGFIPEMRAGGGGIDKAIYDLKFKLNG